MNNFPDEASPSVPGDLPTIEGNNWIEERSPSPVQEPKQRSFAKQARTLATVETAFLASTASLIWLINYYFPLGPLLRIFFPIPLALIYMRWGHRAAWMGAIVSGLLLSVLMGPTRSIVFLIPYGVMGVHLGACWRRGSDWVFSMLTGAVIGTFGFFFRFWLFSLLLGEDLWRYVIAQATEILSWLFIKLGFLSEPSFALVQALAVISVFINSLLYLFTVHLVGLLVFDRLGNPISRPPEWLKVILDYD
jgi:uncharacterized protein YybS (DUF2232 family)